MAFIYRQYPELQVIILFGRQINFSDVFLANAHEYAYARKNVLKRKKSDLFFLCDAHGQLAIEASCDLIWRGVTIAQIKTVMLFNNRYSKS